MSLDRRLLEDGTSFRLLEDGVSKRLLESSSGGTFSAAWARQNIHIVIGVTAMQKNVSGQSVGAQMLSASDGSVFTGSVTVYVTIDRGTQAIGTVGSGVCAHEGNGLHTYAPAQAETNGTFNEYTFIGTGAIAQTLHIYTIGFDPTAAQWPANVTQFGGSNLTATGGRPEVNTSHAAGTAWGSGAITAASIAADAITDAKVASDVTIASVTGAVGSVTGAVGSVTGAVGSVGAGGITAASLASDTITAAKVAADVTTEIQAGLATAAALSSVASDVTTLLGRVTSGLFTGITSLAQWLGLIAGKQTGNATARTELRATGAGSGTFDETTDAVEALRDNMGTAQTGDSFARLGTPAGASVSADLAAIEAQTDDIGVAGAGLTAVPWNAAWDAEVQSEAADALNAYDPPTKAELDSAVAPLATQASVDTLDNFVDTEVTAIKGVTDKLDTAVELDGAVYRLTVNALEQAPTGGSAPTAAQVADAVWEELIADHSGTAGSTAEALNAAGAAGDPWVTSLPGAYGAGSAGKIVGDNVNATISSRASQTSVDDLPTTAELATALAAADDAVLAAVAAVSTLVNDVATNAELATALGTADDAVLAAIAALNNLSQANVRTAVGLASANLDTQLTAIDDSVDTEIASIIATLATVLAAIDTEVAAIKAKTDNLPADPADQSALEAAITAAQGIITAAIAALNNLSAAQVNLEMLDVLVTDTHAEPAVIPAATASLKDKIGLVALLARNKSTLNTSGAFALRNDADTATIGTRTDSDDATTYTKGKVS